MALLPEEALYLVERGNLDLRWGEGGEEDEEIEDGWSLSLQAAYALLCGELGLTLERFTVYAGLKRCGYIVQRAPTWDGVGDLDTVAPNERTTRDWIGGSAGGLFTWLYRSLWGVRRVDARPRGPLVAPGLYRSYSACSTNEMMKKDGVANLSFCFSQMIKTIFTAFSR